MIFSLIFIIIQNSQYISSVHIVKHEINHALRIDYIKGNRANGNYIHRMIIAIKQNNLDELEKILYDVSDINSHGFGHYLTKQEVGELVQNPVATLAVKQWLETHNVNIISESLFGEYITVDATVSTWETMFHAEFYEFKKVNSDKPIVIRTASLSIPFELNDHIHCVFRAVPLPAELTHHAKIRSIVPMTENNSGQMNNISSSGLPALFSFQTVTPTVLKSMYNIFSDSNSLGYSNQTIYGTVGQTYLASDVASFETYFGISSNIVTNVGLVPNNSVCQVSTTVGNCYEASLDVQYIIGVANTVPTYYNYDSSNDGTFDTWITSITSSHTITDVYSISYGANEYQIPVYYLNVFNTEAIKLGAQGSTIVVSSGGNYFLSIIINSLFYLLF